MIDCIPSPKGRTIRSGHKQVYVPGRGRQYAHRLAWEEAYGPIPEGMKVRHACDNPPCINPAHLLIGTQADNVRDMDERGRRGVLRGEESSLHKLTEDDVRYIRSRPEPVRAMARRYGVTDQAIYYILNRKNWAHVS